MNISTGGPHILLFERDQQLTALLISEFQLAGYECHIARTAVEVFDAIARYPIRLVLVNFAQAAAGRREFWVALDTQRRGRGVQVFTFRCTNLAGYGPHDPDERSQTGLADMEVDGMPGLMSLVDAVRVRVTGAGAATNSMPRVQRGATSSPTTPSVNAQTPPRMSPDRQGIQAATRGSVAAPPQPPIDASSASKASNPSTTPASAATPPTSSQAASGTASGTQSYTEKIRAVLYPNQRSWSSQSGMSTAQETGRPLYETQSAQNRAAPSFVPTTLQQLANGQVDEQRESSLAQLSRMVQEHSASFSDDTSDSAFYPPSEAVQPTVTLPIAAQTARPATTADPAVPNAGTAQYAPTPARPSTENISTQPLRASPIQDIPIERANSGQAGSESTRRPDVVSRTNYGQSVTPLASIATPPAAPATSSSVKQQVPVTAPIRAVPAVPVQPVAPTAPATEPPPVSVPQPPPQFEQAEVEEEVNEDEATGKLLAEELVAKEQGKQNESYKLYEQVQAGMQQALKQRSESEASTTPNNTTLLDIVQSFPLMPSPPQMSPQAVSGRAMRSLGSVLLEGHLVPHNRLEVAQNIQRLLRGVDLNYQLGEILLMFKLLTPDQLLAASLVSYGLITTTQISALGRIRQELHAIGLEYDLESLLVLFRILTSEQLREVQSSWKG